MPVPFYVSPRVYLRRPRRSLVGFPPFFRSLLDCSLLLVRVLRLPRLEVTPLIPHTIRTFPILPNHSQPTWLSR